MVALETGGRSGVGARHRVLLALSRPSTAPPPPPPPHPCCRLPAPARLFSLAGRRGWSSSMCRTTSSACRPSCAPPPGSVRGWRRWRRKRAGPRPSCAASLQRCRWGAGGVGGAGAGGCGTGRGTAAWRFPALLCAPAMDAAAACFPLLRFPPLPLPLPTPRPPARSWAGPGGDAGAHAHHHSRHAERRGAAGGGGPPAEAHEHRCVRLPLLVVVLLPLAGAVKRSARGTWAPGFAAWDGAGVRAWGGGASEGWAHSRSPSRPHTPALSVPRLC